MILDSEVIVKTKYNSNLDYYKSLGYDVNSDEITVDIKHLPLNSFSLVNVSCDYCGILEKIPYYKWNRSMKSQIKKYCCTDCKGEKIKESNLIKHGVTSVAKLESSKEKSKRTNLEKYGVEFQTQSNLVKEKIKEKNLEKFGFENPMKSPEVREKQVNTIKNKWGVDNVSKLDEIKTKKKETTLSNWGVDHPLKSEEIKNKIKKTNLEKFGNQYFTKTEIWRKGNYDIANDEFYVSYINNGISIFKCDFGQDHNFEISKDVYSKRKLYNVNLCTICNPVGENKSIKEKELFNWISERYSGEIIQTYRDGRMEIDIYLPDLMLGFEFNGLYWHSTEYKDKKFHINKTNFFKERGIRIIHIWEDDWDFKKEIVKSQISNLLRLNKRSVFARKCKVKEITDTREVKNFLNLNHIQGPVNSALKIGLYYDDELISLMTFDHFEGRNKMKSNEWNLNRFCSKLGVSVIGGASKLFNFFINNYDVKRIVSYADGDWSVGDLYYKLEFNLVYQTNPDYKYIVNGKRIHKSRFRKSKTSISESKLEIHKIWDCGKLKFERILS
jgi:hypothetical protein